MRRFATVTAIALIVFCSLGWFLGCSKNQNSDTRSGDAAVVGPSEPEVGWVLTDDGHLDPAYVVNRDSLKRTATVRFDNGKQDVLPTEDIVHIASGKAAFMATQFEYCAVSTRQWQLCLRTRKGCLLPSAEHCTDRTVSAYESIGRLRALWSRLILREHIARAGANLPESPIPNEQLIAGRKVLAPQDGRWGIATLVRHNHELCTVRIHATQLQFPLSCEQLADVPPEPRFVAEVGKLVVVRPANPNDLWWPVSIVINVPDVGVEVIDSQSGSRRVSINDLIGLREKVSRSKLEPVE
jgi:hypothetical protein